MLTYFFEGFAWSGQTNLKRFLAVSMVLAPLNIYLLFFGASYPSSRFWVDFVIAGLIAVPTVGFSVRRLHDGGYSGLWVLLLFTPFAPLAYLSLLTVPTAKSPWKPKLAHLSSVGLVLFLGLFYYRAILGFSEVIEIKRNPLAQYYRFIEDPENSPIILWHFGDPPNISVGDFPPTIVVEGDVGGLKTSVRKLLVALSVGNPSRNSVGENWADLTPLSGQTELQALIIDYAPQLTSLTGIEDLQGLKVLRLHDMPLTNLNGIENLTNLEHLSIWSSSDISDFRALASLKKLKYLHLVHNGRSWTLDTLPNLDQITDEYLSTANPSIPRLESHGQTSPDGDLEVGASQFPF